MNLLARVLPLVALVLFAACLGTGKPRPATVKEDDFEPDTSGRVVYMQPTPTSTRAVVTKNYAVGQRRVATVGEPMITVRNYTAADRVVAAVALQPFRQLCRKPKEGIDPEKLVCSSGRLSLLRAEPRDRFEVPGGFVEAGKAYYFARIPGKGGDLYLVVDTTGRVRPGDYVAWAPDDVKKTPVGVPLRWQDTPVPLQVSGPVFRYETEETLVPESANFVHYELVYKGTTYDFRGMVYHIHYKEFRRDNPSLPQFVQNLEFAGNASTVDVLGLRLRVHDVNDSQIVYTVLRD